MKGGGLAMRARSEVCPVVGVAMLLFGGGHTAVPRVGRCPDDFRHVMEVPVAGARGFHECSGVQLRCDALQRREHVDVLGIGDTCCRERRSVRCSTALHLRAHDIVDDFVDRERLAHVVVRAGA